MSTTRGLIKSSGPPAPQYGPPSISQRKTGESHSVETDTDGRLTENIQERPSVPTDGPCGRPG